MGAICVPNCREGRCDFVLSIIVRSVKKQDNRIKFGRAVYLTLNVKVSVIESQSATFSLDIDTPDDLNYVSRLTGLQPQNSSGE